MVFARAFQKQNISLFSTKIIISCDSIDKLDAAIFIYHKKLVRLIRKFLLMYELGGATVYVV